MSWSLNWIFLGIEPFSKYWYISKVLNFFPSLIIVIALNDPVVSGPPIWVNALIALEKGCKGYTPGELRWPTKLTFIDFSWPRAMSINVVGELPLRVEKTFENSLYKYSSDSFIDFPDRLNKPALSSYIFPSRVMMYFFLSCVSPQSDKTISSPGPIT